MLSVILTIIKIIVLLLLLLIALLLVLLLLVLFVPLRYRGSGRYLDTAEGKLELSWLLRMLRVQLEYQEGLKGKLCLLGLTLWHTESKQENTTPEESEASSVNAETALTEGESDREAESSAHEITDSIPEKTAEGEEKLKFPQAESLHSDYIQSEKKEKRRKKRKKEGERTALKTRLSQLAAKKDAIFNKADAYRKLLLDPHTGRLLALLKKKGMRLLKEFLPRHLEGDLRFGFEDPFVTGQCCSAAALLYPLYQDNLCITALFDRKELSGALRFRGRVRLIVPLLAALQLWFNRDFKFIYHWFKRKERIATEDNHG